MLCQLTASGSAPTGDAAVTQVEWVAALSSDKNNREALRVPFSPSGLKDLAADHDLVVTEAALEAAAALHGPTVWDGVDNIRVFARMSPHGKAKVIRSMQRCGAQVLMCGDGGNDVGALKQADVGLALLSGYGNMNTTEALEGADAAAGASPARSYVCASGCICVYLWMCVYLCVRVCVCPSVRARACTWWSCGCCLCTHGLSVLVIVS